MKKTTLYLFMLMASFSWQSLSAQIPNAKFKFEFGDNQYNANSNYSPAPISPLTQIDGFYIKDEPTGVDINGNTEHENFTAVFEVDLSAYNKSEGDVIYIYNESYNVGNAIWDINWHGNSLPLTPAGGGSGTCPYIGTYVETDLFDQSDVYGLPLTIPTYGGVSNSQGEITHNLWLAPGNFGAQSCESAWWSPPSSWQRWQGLHNSCSTKRVIKIEITVKDVPECFESQIICPGEILDMNAINPNGYTASNWSPFNPTTEGVDETTTFSVDLESTYFDVNGNTVTNSTTCTFQVEVINPLYDLIDVDMLCANDLPYSFDVSGATGSTNNIWSGDNEPLEIIITRTFGNSSVTNIAFTESNWFVDGLDQNSQTNYFDEASLTFDLYGFYEINYTYGTYINGDYVICTKTYELTIHKKPKIVLPEEISFCGNNFEPICIPNPPANYLFTWQNPLGAVYQSSSNPCFTPTHYGNHTLVVSNKFGCEYEYNINVLQGIGPKIYLNDVKYCKDSLNMPSLIGFNYSLINVQSYSWTFNGDPIVGINGAPNSPQIPFPFNDYDVNGNITELKDGNYCVTVTWNDGCQSKACFEVVECCEMPDASFQIYNSSVSYPGGTLTVINNPNNTSSYTQEVFTVYVWCPGIHTGWTFFSSTLRNSNFNTPYVFTGLSSKCNYKVVHSIKSPCGKDTNFQYTTNGSGPLPIIVYPNPPKKGMPVNIEMKSYADPAFVEITNLVTGKRIFNGTLEYNNPIKVDYSVFMKTKGASFGMYNVKVYNKTSVVNKKLIVR